MKTKYKSIIFDLDGTLINSEKVSSVALQKLLQTKAGLTDITIEEILPKLGRTGTLILKDFGIPEDEIDDYLNEWMELVYQNSVVELFEDTLPVLEKLKTKNVKLGIVSSKTREVYTLEKEHFDLDPYFDHIVLSDDTDFHKPHPAPLLKYLELSQHKADECLYIGDAYSDLVCAKDTNVDFGLACWGSVSTFDHEQDIHRFRTFADVLEILDFE